MIWRKLGWLLALNLLALLPLRPGHASPAQLESELPVADSGAEVVDITRGDELFSLSITHPRSVELGLDEPFFTLMLTPGSGEPERMGPLVPLDTRADEGTDVVEVLRTEDLFSLSMTHPRSAEFGLDGPFFTLTLTPGSGGPERMDPLVPLGMPESEAAEAGGGFSEASVATSADLSGDSTTLFGSATATAVPEPAPALLLWLAAAALLGCARSRRTH